MYITILSRVAAPLHYHTDSQPAAELDKVIRDRYKTLCEDRKAEVKISAVAAAAASSRSAVCGPVLPRPAPRHPAWTHADRAAAGN